jgi:4-amino-4-deoxy-L-arabinose transferase-like glycosyltransferase
VSRARFFALLGVIVLVAAGVRVAFVLGDARHDRHFYDAFYYELQADVIADGKGYTVPAAYLPGGDQIARPAADHPPVTVTVLAAVAWLSDGSQLAMRFATALAGLGTVLLLGLLGRAVAGERAGLVAAGIGAVYPFLWLNDGLIMSEAFVGVLVTAALLLTYQLRRRPGVWRAAALGAVCGLAALTRAELLLLVPGLLLVFVVAERGRPWRELLVSAVTVVGATLLVLAPWVVYNQSRFEEPVLISTNDGLTLLGANCDFTYHGRYVGLWVLEPCVPAQSPPGDQSAVSHEYRHQALSYMRAHKARLALVMGVRVGRTWNLFRPTDMLAINATEGRPEWATATGLVMYYPLVAGAVVGAVVLRRRRRWLAPLLVPPVIVTLTSLAFYGQTRLRVPAEPCLVVLAAVAVAAAWERWSPQDHGAAAAPA